MVKHPKLWIAVSMVTSLLTLGALAFMRVDIDKRERAVNDRHFASDTTLTRRYETQILFTDRLLAVSTENNAMLRTQDRKLNLLLTTVGIDPSIFVADSMAGFQR